ncbi:hypothetical protein SCB71_14010 [Herbiconiux sp. KACC 21604]|uniref:hypothetical protein n=1 Tax=unclassified Herbiconiux TaxID=2618217 RepID=UPI001492E95D|nr:hypothetical protein [Herbiconiux sp. SALV-R1]QJU54259.1 hypothetical protein HL652_11955 [Herbiconiux sp. SALV-R1]WPO85326.1 hypothetical protein SCB71_14010 [Herbiconiux sp. KACC 21604]
MAIPSSPDAYGRARRDKRFREALVRAYDGRHDALDALWWLGRPDRPAPDGTPSPHARLAELEAAVYGPDARHGDPAAPAALEALLAELAADRAAIERAVRAAEREVDDAAQPLGGSGGGDSSDLARVDGPLGTADPLRTGDPLGTDPLGVDDLEPGPTVLDPRRPRSPSALTLAAVAAVALLAGVAGGIALGSGALGGPSAEGVSAGWTGNSEGGFNGLAPGAQASPGATVDTPAALQIFDREQVPSDLPPVLHSLRLRETTLRPLGPTATGALYAARDVDDRVCLVHVDTQGSYAASCVWQTAFPADGLLLRVSSPVPAPGPDTGSLPSGAQISDLEVRWMPDGTLTGQENPMQLDPAS